MALSSESTANSKNAILAQFSLDKIPELRRGLQLVDLRVPQSIYEPGQSIAYAYFPQSGMISVVAQMDDGNSIEVGTIGREGMTGGSLLMGKSRALHRHFVQVGGAAYRIGAAQLIAAADRNAALLKLILRYEASLLGQSMQCIACNSLHTAEQRCCRWLLMAHDRSDSDEIALAHELLGLMIGVLRASVSDVLRPLQDAKLISFTQGRITVLDRPGLECAACECYRLVAEQQKLPIQ